MADEFSNQPFVRPDPEKGRIGDANYAAYWAKAHDASADDLDYRNAYADLLLLDGLLPLGYSLLDVGCGTAGYHRLLRRQGRVLGVDPIPEMMDTANRFKAEFDIRGAEYRCCTFEELSLSERYDGIHMRGVFGWYIPWHGQAAVLRKVRELLNPSGVAVLSYVPPESPFGLAKALLVPGKTVVITRSRFLRMVRGVGLSVLFEIKTPDAALVFAAR